MNIKDVRQGKCKVLILDPKVKLLITRVASQFVPMECLFCMIFSVWGVKEVAHRNLSGFEKELISEN